MSANWSLYKGDLIGAVQSNVLYVHAARTELVLELGKLISEQSLLNVTFQFTAGRDLIEGNIKVVKDNGSAHGMVRFEIVPSTRVPANADELESAVYLGHFTSFEEVEVVEWSQEPAASDMEALKGHELVIEHAERPLEYIPRCRNCGQPAKPQIIFRGLGPFDRFHEYMKTFARFGSPQWFMYKFEFAGACKEPLGSSKERVGLELAELPYLWRW
jgi:hypothetical protein